MEKVQNPIEVHPKRTPQFWLGILIGTGVALAVKTLASSDEGKKLAEKLYGALEPTAPPKKASSVLPAKTAKLLSLPPIRRYIRRKRYFKQKGKKLNT
jgi:hypothetical protein